MRFLQKILNYPFARFVLVGVINTAVDLLVLNLLLALVGGETSVLTYTSIKIVSFLAAVTNSYFMNKYWVFEEKGARSLKEGSTFLAVSLVGLLLNVATSSVIFFALQKTALSNEHIAGTCSAVIGTLIVFCWNYFGYTRLVFKKVS